MQQARDFLEESEALAAILADVPEEAWNRATRFKGWTLNDVIVHLLFWNRAVDLALQDPDALRAMVKDILAYIAGGSLRDLENARVEERGKALYAAWTEQFRAMLPHWEAADPKHRVPWAGPDMSVRSSITARQMETWAHGQAIFDLLGIERQESDARIRNIVMLGVNTFGWSHKVQGLAVPDAMPLLRLTAPSGEIWEYGEAEDAGLIEGPAVDFARVVTQTRNIADTALKTEGEVARRWMETAQCFAGPPETPPAPGARRIDRL